MADFRVRIEAIRGNLLTCCVIELDGKQCPIESSLSLAFGFLWDTVEDSSYSELPLAQELVGRRFYDDQDWNLDNAERFISCFGVVDWRVVIVSESGLGSHIPGWKETRQATYNISVTDPKWLEALSPGEEWESTKANQGWVLSSNPAWRTSDVIALAKRINESQDFSGMPILADALQEIGCDDEYILHHLRDTTATHVRGCWALDLVLGKE